MSAHQVGLRWLRLLDKHAELILSAYHAPQGHLTETADNTDVIAELIANRIAFRQDDGDGVRLTSSLRKAMDYALRTQKLYVVDAHISEHLNEITRLGIAYKEGRRASGADATLILSELEDMVYSLCENLKESSRQIWRHIETKFSGVTTLDMKLRLNQLTLTRAENICKAIELISLENLYDISGSNPDLRRLFNIQLAGALDYAFRDMSDAFVRLNKILFDLREMQERTRLVQRFMRHYRRNPSYVPQAYDEAAYIPPLFRLNAPLTVGGYAPVLTSRHELALEALIAGLRSEPRVAEVVEIEPIVASESFSSPEVYYESVLRKSIRNLFTHALTQNMPVSGLHAYNAETLEETPAVWLYGILAEYNALSVSDRTHFQLIFEGEYDAEFNGNFKASDIIVCPN